MLSQEILSRFPLSLRLTASLKQRTWKLNSEFDKRDFREKLNGVASDRSVAAYAEQAAVERPNEGLFILDSRLAVRTEDL